MKISIIKYTISQKYQLVGGVNDRRFRIESHPMVRIVCAPRVKEKHVRFSDNNTVYEYENECQCMQDYYNSCLQCKETFLRNQFLIKHGSLDGFDLENEKHLSDVEDDITMNMYVNELKQNKQQIIKIHIIFSD